MAVQVPMLAVIATSHGGHDVSGGGGFGESLPVAPSSPGMQLSQMQSLPAKPNPLIDFEDLAEGDATRPQARAV